jgi:hypothetical protein
MSRHSIIHESDRLSQSAAIFALSTVAIEQEQECATALLKKKRASEELTHG